MVLPCLKEMGTLLSFIAAYLAVRMTFTICTSTLIGASVIWASSKILSTASMISEYGRELPPGFDLRAVYFAAASA